VPRWSGWERRSGAPAASSGRPFGADDGAGDATVLELLALAGRGFRPPPIVTVGGDPDGLVAAGTSLRRSWSLEYRQLAETAPRAAAPFAIYLLGVDPPEGATADELAEFNDFYTNVHLVEVAERRHALRAVRYELADVITAPPKGAPRFLAVYEVDEASAAARRHSGPPYAKGPSVWQAHTTPWRIWYRVLEA
jgi:hypothetical protein